MPVPRSKPGEIPQIQFYATRNMACIYIERKRFYLGPWDSPGIEEARQRVWAEYLAKRKVQIGANEVVTVAILVDRFLDYAKGHYVKHGRQTSTYGLFLDAVKPLLELYASTPVADFRPLALKTVRQNMLDSGKLCRKTINERVRCIKQIFSWGVGEELVGESAAATLRYVSGLAEGETTAIDYDEIAPVDFETVEKTIPHCSHPIIADMIHVQMYGGMRPQDVCNMRFCDIKQNGDVWDYVPWEHKTEHVGKGKKKGKKNKIIRWLGPKAQEILAPYMTAKATTPEAFLFSPVDAVKYLDAEKRMNRQSKVQPSQEDRSKPNPMIRPGDKYTTGSYRTAIKRACKRGGIEEWSPNQLRHTWATYVEQKYGADAARIILGHTNVDTTLIYIERDNARGREIAREIG